MSDFRVKELIELLKQLPQDARVCQSSGERKSILWIETVKGKYQGWSITEDGRIDK